MLRARASENIHPIQFLGGIKFSDAKDAKSASIKIKKERKNTTANADVQNNRMKILVQAIGIINYRY